MSINIENYVIGELKAHPPSIIFVTREEFLLFLYKIVFHSNWQECNFIHSMCFVDFFSFCFSLFYFGSHANLAIHCSSSLCRSYNAVLNWLEPTNSKYVDIYLIT